MKILGIIVEYNPFHNGHLYHLKKAKELTDADYTIAIMSGNYVQRGEPSCVDKLTRAKMALSEGVDLVIELPTIYSSSSAEFFAHKSVEILNSLGCVDYLCFGAETNDINSLSSIADILVREPRAYKKALKLELSKGISFPKARARAIAQITDYREQITDILNSSNNILGIEYLKALKRLKSQIKPCTVQRTSVGYHDENIVENITSATNIRKMICDGNFSDLEKVIPPNAYKIFKERLSEQKEIITLKDYYDLLQHKLRLNSKANLKNILGMNEGIENRLLRLSDETNNMSDLIDQIKTKRYTNTFIKRLLLHTSLGITSKYFKQMYKDKKSTYARVLGFRKDSQQLLKILMDNSKVPVIMNINKDLSKLNKKQLDILHNDIMYSNVYNYMNKNENLKKLNQDYKQKMIVV